MLINTRAFQPRGERLSGTISASGWTPTHSLSSLPCCCGPLSAGLLYEKVKHMPNF